MYIMVPKEIIKTASSKDIKELMSYGLLNKNGQDYSINYFLKKHNAFAIFFLPRPTGDVCVSFQGTTKKFFVSSYIEGTNNTKTYNLPLGELKDFAEIISKAQDLDDLWDYNIDDPVLKVKSRVKTNNLLSALTGSNQDLVEVDITPYLIEIEARLDVVERVLGEMILM